MLGERLKLARKQAGLSLQTLSDRMDRSVTPQALSKYETGKMLPSSEVLVSLGKALGVSLDFLMSSQVESLHSVEFRKHANTTAKDRAHAESLVIQKLESYLAIEEILEIKVSEDPFAEIRCETIESFSEAEEKAGQLRMLWKLGNDPIPSMTALLEDKGIKVIEEDLPDRFDGLACEVKRSNGKPDTEVIVVSSRTNIERRRFSLAHEVAHRVIKRTANNCLDLEKAMHRFAGAFLAPSDHLLQEVGSNRKKITYYEIIKLKRLYGMSAAAMLIRLRDIGLLPVSVVDYAFRSYARAWRTNEPEPIINSEGFGSFEKPMRFEQLVYRALGEEIISPIRAAQLLKRPISAIEEEIKGPAIQ